MSSINDNKKDSYFDSHYLSEELDFHPIDANCSATSSTCSPYYAPYYRSMSSINTPFGAAIGSEGVDSIGSSNAVRNKILFTPFENPSSNSAQTPNIFENMEKKSDFECNENKIEFKILVQYLENLRQNNQIFQTNILKELRQMREVMADLKKSIQEMPIRFADALSQCLDLVNGPSDSLSVDSEPEIVNFFNQIVITDDIKEDDSFVDFCDNSSKESESESVHEKSGSTVDKFVFEYNPYIDLEKWLKKN